MATVAAILAIPVVSKGESFVVGTLTVETYGDHGLPVILIPGLACGGWVWDNTVDKLRGDYKLYVVTLPGFSGTAPVKGEFLPQVHDSLLELIRSRKIERPVLVGHSLGGIVSIQFAQKHSDLISGVVSVEGLPVFPGTERFPANQRKTMAANFEKQMAGLTPAAFSAQQLMYMKSVGVLDEKLAGEIAARTSTSDPAATGRYTAEVLALDLRAELPAISIPLLEMCPFNPADAAAGQMKTEAAKVEYYRSLLKGTPKLEVFPISPARHFAMLDEPEAFVAKVKDFLAYRLLDPPPPATQPNMRK